jgi:hypothetical protein
MDTIAVAFPKIQPLTHHGALKAIEFADSLRRIVVEALD